jgi:3-oxoacyl-[acyl-carrier-protein] synthase II
VNGVVVTGWSALSSAGIGARALADGLRDLDPDATEVRPGVRVGHLYDEPLPASSGHALAAFDVRAELGRKGTSAYDRATGLVTVCCRDALRGAGTIVDDSTRRRLGVVLGTSLGSFKSGSDFDRDTLVQERLGQVSPTLFPTGVMNYAAGQVAIRFGLKGVNTTLAGGAVAFLNALRYVSVVIGRGHADAVLTGAVEEYTPHRAWAAHLTGDSAGARAGARAGASDGAGDGELPLGEAAAVFVLTGPAVPAWAGDRRSAHIVAVETGYGPGSGEQADEALAGCVSRAVRRAAVDPATISTVLTGETGHADRREYGPVTRALGHKPHRIMVKRLYGDCGSASGALSLAVLLAAGESGWGGLAEGDLALLTARGSDGAVGAAIVRTLMPCRS